MKILHICISNTYIDNWGYQENLLSRYLVKEGIENYVIGSDRHFPPYFSQEGIAEIRKKGKHYEADDSQVTRIKTTRLSLLFIIPHGLYKEIDRIKPDAILHHNVNCTSLIVAARYAKKHKIPLFVDNHVDELNMTPNKIWAFIIHKVLIRSTCRRYLKTISQFYGVTQYRCDFLKKYYKLPESKVSFLPIGADVDLADKLAAKEELRKKYDYCEKDFVIASGGKMDQRKGTDRLIQAVDIVRKKNHEVKLALFGKISGEVTQNLADNSTAVRQFGWCNRMTSLELLKMADVVCWPIHHTTLCEDTIAVGTPLIIRKTRTTEHLVEGNGFFLKEGTIEELVEVIKRFISMSPKEKVAMIEASNRKLLEINYHTIAQRFLEDIKRYKRTDLTLI